MRKNLLHILAYSKKVIYKSGKIQKNWVLKSVNLHLWCQGFMQAILMSDRWHKKLNLLIEFSNAIFIKFYSKAYYHWIFVQKMDISKTAWINAGYVPRCFRNHMKKSRTYLIPKNNYGHSSRHTLNEKKGKRFIN